MSKKPLINKVAKKAIIQIDLESFLPKATDIVAFDIKPFLFKDLILKEKDYRTSIKSFDFSSYKNKYVYAFCSSKAIIPLWAYMLLTSYLSPIAKTINFAQNKLEAEEKFLIQIINDLNIDEYKNQRIVVKGCSNKNFSPSVYMSLVHKLQPFVKSLLFGESCSMLPIYKK